MRATDNVAIDVQGLTLKFGRLTAVDHIDAQVPRGIIFGLLGANGAGKTSTIKMLTTLLEPTSGSARVAGYDIAAAPHEVRRRIGYVPQMLSADGALTGYENLLLSARLYAVPGPERRARIEDSCVFGAARNCGQALPQAGSIEPFAGSTYGSRRIISYAAHRRDKFWDD